MSAEEIQADRRPEPVELFHQLFGHHPANMALLDRDARILAVNGAWRRFGSDNGLRAEYDPVGQNYLEACQTAMAAGDGYAEEAVTGMLGVLKAGRRRFAMEYPCDAPWEKRWFRLWVETQEPHVSAVIVAHTCLRTAPILGVEPDISSRAALGSWSADARNNAPAGIAVPRFRLIG